MLIIRLGTVGPKKEKQKGSTCPCYYMLTVKECNYCFVDLSTTCADRVGSIVVGDCVVPCTSPVNREECDEQVLCLAARYQFIVKDPPAEVSYVPITASGASLTRDEPAAYMQSLHPTNRNSNFVVRDAEKLWNCGNNRENLPDRYQ